MVIYGANMTCEISDRDQRIDDFLMHKLSSADAETFEVHLFGCKECLAELRLREQMIDIIKEERVTAVADAARFRRAKPSAGLVEAIADFFKMRPNAWIYAGVAAALLVAILVSPIFRDKDATEDYAANFAPSQQLESLVGKAARSYNISLSIFSPAIGENFTNDILFRWVIHKDEDDFDEPLDLKIMNNKGNLVHSVKIEGREYYFRSHSASGLYYWTIEDQGEMLYLGKFFVNKPPNK
jgi:hypothetical protein